jgi:hypothetical protein
MSAVTMSRPFACPAAHAAHTGRGTVMVAQERRRSQADIRYVHQRDHKERRGALSDYPATPLDGTTVNSPSPARTGDGEFKMTEMGFSLPQAAGF